MRCVAQETVKVKKNSLKVYKRTASKNNSRCGATPCGVAMIREEVRHVLHLPRTNSVPGRTQLGSLHTRALCFRVVTSLTTPPLATVGSSGQATLRRQRPADLAVRHFDSQQQRVCRVAPSIYDAHDINRRS